MQNLFKKLGHTETKKKKNREDNLINKLKEDEIIKVKNMQK